MNHALPSWAIDLIRYGPSPGDLRRYGYGAVTSALISTAMSAHRRDIDKDRWLDLIYSPTSRLGLLMRTRNGKALTANALGKTTDHAWDKAWLRCSEEGAWTAAEASAEAARRADWLLAVAADPDVDLLDTDRTVLAHVAETARKRGSTHVALARRAAAASTGLGVQAVRLALVRLETRGLLNLVERGRPSGPSSKAPPRASVYGLPEAGSLYISGVPPQVGSSASHVGSPLTTPAGSPVIHVGSSAVTFRVTAEQAELLRRLAADAGLDINAVEEDR